ncbi:hypothetical protein RJ639_043722 [Escallonia herrerae]|uniref:Sodium channel modifier 1 n=1 Tax=Escallonia herrerae TaxID=1293975 RepID=A0AA88WKX5_9ASTE|nr:hypothetical protein RJ639_043722 [Escallonia herrerae]
MSVFRGDSWAREAQHRKRRVNDLIEVGLNHGGGSSSNYKKLSSGKYACLVCPHNPILDTPLSCSLYMHMKGSRHCAAESKLKEREHLAQSEMNQKRALSHNSTATTNIGTSARVCMSASRPLIGRTHKIASEILCSDIPKQYTADETEDVKVGGNSTNEILTYNNCSCVEMKLSAEEVVQQQLDIQERRERELKFTEAGWKRDCHGGWFRDENVEFDSDEEDPNVTFMISKKNHVTL